MSTIELAKAVAPDSAKTLFRRACREWGSTTAAQRPLPDYLIVGAKRGGTTSLWNNLMRHPHIAPMFPAVENLKSPHYFDINWSRGEGWYRSHFPTLRARMARATPDGRPALCGEASPYYLWHPLALERIRATVPDVRILVMLRNPVDRALSHYNERVKDGTEPLDFRDALDAEQERLAGEEERIRADETYYSERHDFCSYLARGRYLEQLRPWLDAFGPEQLFIGRSEDLYEEPVRLLGEVFDFLGLPPYEPEETRHFNKIPTSRMSPQDRAWLADYYAPSVSDLEATLGRSFGWTLG